MAIQPFVLLAFLLNALHIVHGTTANFVGAVVKSSTHQSAFKHTTNAKFYHGHPWTYSRARPFAYAPDGVYHRSVQTPEGEWYGQFRTHLNDPSAHHGEWLSHIILPPKSKKIYRAYRITNFNEGPNEADSSETGLDKL